MLSGNIQTVGNVLGQQIGAKIWQRVNSQILVCLSVFRFMLDVQGGNCDLLLATILEINDIGPYSDTGIFYEFKSYKCMNASHHSHLNIVQVTWSSKWPDHWPGANRRLRPKDENEATKKAFKEMMADERQRKCGHKDLPKTDSTTTLNEFNLLNLYYFQKGEHCTRSAIF